MILCALLPGQRMLERSPMKQPVRWIMAGPIAGVDHVMVTACPPMKLPRYTLILLAALCATSAWGDRQQDPELGQVLKRARDAGECFEDRFDQQVWWAA